MISSVVTGARKSDFSNFAFLVLRSGGSASEAMHDAESIYGATSRIFRHAKDVVTAGSTAAFNSTFGLMFSDWYTQPRDVGLLYAVAPSARKGKIDSRGILITSYAVGAAVPEGAPKPLIQLDMDEPTLVERKCAGILVCSAELLKLTGGSQQFDKELETAIVAAVDTSLAADILSTDAHSFASSGDPFEDFRTLVALVNAKATSRLFVVANASTFSTMSLLDAGGIKLFPDLTYRGGEISGMRAVPVDAMPANVIAVIDASKMIVDVGTVIFDASKEALLEMDTAPANPPTSSTILMSMFQRNMVALKCEAHFGVQFLENSVARVEGIDYSAMST